MTPPPTCQPSQACQTLIYTLVQTALELSRATANALPLKSSAADGSLANAPPEFTSVDDANVVSRMLPLVSRRRATAKGTVNSPVTVEIGTVLLRGDAAPN